MMYNLLTLAQEEGGFWSDLFTVRNLILLIVVILLLVGLKIYKSRQT